MFTQIAFVSRLGANRLDAAISSSRCAGWRRSCKI
jgi:hypothetical protein